MAAAKVQATKDGEVLNVSVSGYIGEGAQLFDLNFAGIKKVAMDLSGISYINSVGVKNWISWTSRFPKGLKIEYHKCPSLIISQINMVVGFLPPTGSVESLTAPFVCPDCSREESRLLLRGVDYQYATLDRDYFFKSPAVVCSKCNVNMELDALESKFFAFLKAQKAG